MMIGSMSRSKLFCVASIVGSLFLVISCKPRTYQSDILQSSPQQKNSTETKVFSLQIDAAAADRIGQVVYQNECAKKPEFLTFWNEREDFPSLGIGHFIWYPETIKERKFDEVFPSFVAYAKENGAQVPSFLQNEVKNPWSDRKQFMAEIDSPRTNELRQFLVVTIPLQSKFIAQRAIALLEDLYKETKDNSERQTIYEGVSKLIKTAQGILSIVDYINFKGLGTKETERYQGEGWGLLQVLTEMKVQKISFADAADFVMERRVKNAPADKKENEKKFLVGWKKRINNTYRVNE